MVLVKSEGPLLDDHHSDTAGHDHRCIRSSVSQVFRSSNAFARLDETKCVELSIRAKREVGESRIWKPTLQFTKPKDYLPFSVSEIRILAVECN